MMMMMLNNFFLVTNIDVEAKKKKEKWRDQREKSETDRSILEEVKDTYHVESKKAR